MSDISPSLSDLRSTFFGGGSAAEYQFLLSAKAAGLTAAVLLGSTQLDSAISSAFQAAIGAVVDLTNLVIDFTVTGSPVIVWAFLPWVTASAADNSATLEITDEANAVQSQGSETIPVANAQAGVQVQAFEIVTVPGVYNRKARLRRNVGAGTLSNNINASALAKSHLIALELR